jgi:hypothetical protein
MKYKLASMTNADCFEAEVNKLISEGWKPHGGVSVVELCDGLLGYMQAMVKDEQ